METIENTVTENNKKIADFMQTYSYKKELESDILSVHLIEEMKFDSDWNWLMEVVEKIEKTTINDDFYKFFTSIASTGTTIIAKTKIGYPNSNYSNCETEKGKITNTYNAIIHFIDWHNENKK